MSLNLQPTIYKAAYSDILSIYLLLALLKVRIGGLTGKQDCIQTGNMISHLNKRVMMTQIMTTCIGFMNLYLAEEPKGHLLATKAVTW